MIAAGTGRSLHDNLFQVGHTIQAASIEGVWVNGSTRCSRWRPGRGGDGPAKNVLVLAVSQGTAAILRRAYIYSAGNLCAVRRRAKPYAAHISATSLQYLRNPGCGTLGREQVADHGTCPIRGNPLPEGRSFHILCAGKIRATGAISLVGKEEEEFLFQNRATQAAAKLPQVGHILPRLLAVRATPAAEGVETRVVEFEEAASMKLICAALRNNLNLRAAISAIFRGVGVRHDS